MEKIENVFVLGKEWLPIPRSDSFSAQKEPGTLPVGGITPTGTGLFDVTANVAEWCEDRSSANDSDARMSVLRGPASWQAHGLWTSSRVSEEQGLRRGNWGFSVVLAPVAALPPSSIEMAATAILDLLPATHWEDALHDRGKLVFFGDVEWVRGSGGLRFLKPGSAILRAGHGPNRAGAIRMRATYGSGRPQLRARVNPAGSAYYFLHAGENFVMLAVCDNAARQFNELRRFPVSAPFRDGWEYELELRVVGSTLSAILDGTLLGTVTDKTLVEGSFGVGVGQQSGAPALIEFLEVLSLDAP